MFVKRMPYNNYILRNVVNKFKLSESVTQMEEGSFLINGIENGKGVAKVGSTDANDSFLGIAISGYLGKDEVVVLEGKVPADKVIELPSTVIANTECVKVEGAVKAATTDYTISGTTFTFVTANENDSYKIVYKKLLTVDDIENLKQGIVGWNDQAAFTDSKNVSIAVDGRFPISNFDSSCDFENATSLKIDANGNLTTKGNGCDVTSRVKILQLPDETDGFMLIELLG